MKHEMFSIFDAKSLTWSTPFYALNIQTAQRMFTDACMDPSTQFYKTPADFSLYHVGEFHDGRGTIEQIPQAEIINGFIAKATAMAELKEQEAFIQRMTLNANSTGGTEK